MTETTYLDISESVTAEDHRRVLEKLLEQFEQWRLEQRWCTDLYKWVGRLSTSYAWERYAWGVYPGYDGAMRIQPDPEMTDAQRARDLRAIRGRILMFTIDQPDYIDIERANRFLTTAGLAPYEQSPAPTTTRMYVSLGGYIETELNADEVRKKMRRSFTRLGGDGAPDVYTNVERSRTPAIPSSETTAPLVRGRSY